MRNFRFDSDCQQCLSRDVVLGFMLQLLFVLYILFLCVY